MRPQRPVPGEAITVAGPGGGLRVAPGLVGDAGQAGQQQEGQVVEAGDGLGPDRGLDSRDLGRPAGPERLGGLPAERFGDGLGRIEPQAEVVAPVRLRGIGRRLGVGHVKVAVAQR